MTVSMKGGDSRAVKGKERRRRRRGERGGCFSVERHHYS
jgi:hypothetical protein